jgi:hypothetical protein
VPTYRVIAKLLCADCHQSFMFDAYMAAGSTDAVRPKLQHLTLECRNYDCYSQIPKQIVSDSIYVEEIPELKAKRLAVQVH